MLQWMGGSRRKVTTSRKSMHKRQKQYFEQKKRQQQQQAAGSESYTADGMNLCVQHHNEHRSLDVLNLLNLSTASQECKSTCPSDLEVSGSEVKYYIKKGPSTILNHTDAPANSVECKKERSPSHCQEEVVSPKNLLSVHDDNHIVLNGAGSKVDLWKTAPEHQLSVLDLVGDEEPNGNKESGPMYEAHAAFSVEGLGEVGTETPVHSPPQPGRYFSIGRSSPLKATRQLNMSKNHNYLLDDLELDVDKMMKDINMPPSGSSLDFSSGKMHSYSNPNQKLAAVRYCMQHDGHGSQINSLLGERSIFNDLENGKEDIWDARSCFLADNLLDEREFDASRKNWSPEIDGNSLDFWKYGNSVMSDYAFEGPDLLKKRDATTAMDRFNIIEPPASFYKHQTAENDLDFMNYNGARRPTPGRKFGFGDVTKQSDWFCFATDDGRDNMCMLSSEESCSSSAVRGEVTNNSQSNSAARRTRRRSNACISPRKKYGVNSIFGKETGHKSKDEIGQGNDVRGSGKFPNVSKLSHSNNPLQKNLGPNDSWLCDEGYTTGKVNSGFGPFSRDSETKIPSSGSKFWTGDPPSEFPIPGSDIDARSSLFGRSKLGGSLACSRSGSFIAEKLPVHDSPVFSKFEFGPTVPDLSPDSKLEGTTPESSFVAGYHGEKPFPDISTDESASKDVENKAKIQPHDREELELMGEVQIGNGLFSENEKAIDAASSGGNNCGCKNAEDEAPEPMQNLKTTYSPHHAEQASRSLIISDKLESIVEEQKLHCRNESTIPCQNGDKDIQVMRPQERRLIRKTESKCDNSSCQVMMLESYVLQLLSVKKVPMHASAQDTTKKLERLQHEFLSSFIQAPVQAKKT
ncbi:hypothetical protein I3842_13G062700 [Carya illinoinensis]|uniref:Uncharacterized protein n=1 Tax=Carya illinoinensis TaxID=32201 RepID=A0A922AKJ9_CARIL|nr:hypothetical protein I3842_13G062700 [Carya illinoinensis]